MSGQFSKRRMALTAALAAAAVIGMTGLSFAAVPLYRLFCSVTGYGGTTQNAVAASDIILDRTVDVRFDTNVANGAPLEFAPEQRAERLRIGETGMAKFRVRNLSDRSVRVQARFNVTPHKAGQYFAKLACFCLDTQELAPHEEMELPVVYFVDPQLASDYETEDVTQITLSYTYFECARATAQNSEC